MWKLTPSTSALQEGTFFTLQTLKLLYVKRKVKIESSFENVFVLFILQCVIHGKEIYCTLFVPFLYSKINKVDISKWLVDN